MKGAVLLFLCCGLVVGLFCPSTSVEDVRSHFYAWKAQYHREYTDQAEHDRRFDIFTRNLQWIAQHNSFSSSYCVQVNQFADLSSEEFREIMLSPSHIRPTARTTNQLSDVSSLPSAWDWRDFGVVTPAKNQGHCNSCWAFATTGAIESYHAIQNGTLISLSEQNLMDCSWREGNRGCGGGTVDASFQYVMRSGGIDTEASYPYLMATTTDCHYNSSNSGAFIANYTDIPRGDEGALQEAVVRYSPVAALIDGNDPGFQFYSSGIYYNPFCTPWRLNHAVLVVGYDTSNTSYYEYDQDVSEYWIAKNSFGTTWGDDGYILMARNMNNSCGIASQASYPL